MWRGTRSEHQSVPQRRGIVQNLKIKCGRAGDDGVRSFQFFQGPDHLPSLFAGMEMPGQILEMNGEKHQQNANGYGNGFARPSSRELGKCRGSRQCDSE